MVRKGTVEEVFEITTQIPEFKNPYSITEFQRRLDADNSLILLSEREGKLVGFKCGYERDKGSASFYSWMGGVLPGYRSSGVATELLLAMEEWCSKEGYASLTFKTLNEHKAMLIFAIKHEFEIVEVENKEAGSPRIWLRKKLI